MLLLVMVTDHLSAQKRLQTPALSRRCDTQCSLISGIYAQPAQSHEIKAERDIVVDHFPHFTAGYPPSAATGSNVPSGEWTKLTSKLESSGNICTVR